jgi:hypothetical protein
MYWYFLPRGSMGQGRRCRKGVGSRHTEQKEMKFKKSDEIRPSDRCSLAHRKTPLVRTKHCGCSSAPSRARLAPIGSAPDLGRVATLTPHWAPPLQHFNGPLLSGQYFRVWAPFEIVVTEMGIANVARGIARACRKLPRTHHDDKRKGQGGLRTPHVGPETAPDRS